MNVKFRYEPLRSNGQLRARLTAKQDGRTLHRDTFDLSSASRRAQFARETADRAGVPVAEVERTLLELGDRQAEQPSQDGGVREAPDDPNRLARMCLAQLWTIGEGETCLAFRYDRFLEWDGAKYVPVSDEEVRVFVTEAIQRVFDRLADQGVVGKGGFKLKVRRNLVSDVVQSLKAITVVDSVTEAPCWLEDGRTQPPENLPAAANLLATRSGLVDLQALAEGRPCQYPPTPRFFTRQAVDYDFDPNAECPRWEGFMHDIWPQDSASIELLQEWCGYSLVNETSQQKVLVLVGPKRSGKGTAMRVLRRLVDPSSVAGPSLQSLAGRFGLEGLLGKRLAIIPDVRLSGRADWAAIAERLLSISGEDAVDVERKYKSPITTKLPTRFVMVSNELPALRDTSGVLASRLLVLATRRSWYGEEDPNLEAALAAELPGIFLWAAQGLQRLRQRGRFVQPESARPLIRQLERLSSPIAAFLQEGCIFATDAQVPRQALYDAWSTWCAAAGVSSRSREQFGRDLRALLPELENSHLTINGRRVWCYGGLRLRTRDDPD